MQYRFEPQPLPPAFDEIEAGENALALIPGPGPVSHAAHVYRAALDGGADLLSAMQEALFAVQETALAELKLHLERRLRA